MHHRLAAHLARLLQLAPDHGHSDPLNYLHFVSPAYDGARPGRLYAITTHQDGTQGFAKIACGSKARDKLRREYEAGMLAAQLGYATLRVLTPYRESGEGVGVIEFEYVTEKEVLSSIKTEASLALLPAYRGQQVAEAVLSQHGRPLPHDLAPSQLEPVDWFTTSPRIFIDAFQHDVRRLLIPEHCKLLDSLSNTLMERASSQVNALVEEACHYLPSLLAKGEAFNGEKFFCKNDLAPYNLFFPLDLGNGRFTGSPVIFFDWGGAGVTGNAVMASLVDWGNFYARSHPNHGVQQAFLHSLLQARPCGSLTETHTLLRCAVITRTVFVATLGLIDCHSTPEFALSLLQWMPSHLQALDDAYMQLVDSDQGPKA